MPASLVSLASLLDAFDALTQEIRLAAIILRRGRLLLVEHQKRGSRYWVLPGGRLQPRETLRAALQRELVEELALRATIGRLVIVCETLAPRRHVVNLIFQATAGEGQPRPDPRDGVIVGMDWVLPDRLGALDFRPPIASQVQAVVAERFGGPVQEVGDTWKADA